LHDDPADRIIVATSLVLGLALVTKDRRLLDYEHAKTLW
jgi:PIN domain nuclease of toxin-antitoxin system